MDSFQPVKSGKISELVARQIKSSILSGTMKPGDRLPSERELVERFQVSRISVREALKNLETSGLLTIRHGHGVFVAEINSRPMVESLSSILRMKKASINDLTEARLILEPSIAKLAFEKITQEDLLKLEQNIQEASGMVKSNSSASSQNIEFHSLIAESTHNPVITLTMKTLFDVLKEMTLEIVDDSPKNIKNSSKAVSYHKKILEAFREKDVQKGCGLMLKHVLQIQEGLKERKSENE